MAAIAPPPGLDEFLAQSAPEPTSNQPLASATTPGEPPGLDAFIEPELNQAKYGTPSQMAITAAEGLGRGVAGPLAPYLETKMGVKPEDIAGRAEANPVLHGSAEAAGLIGPVVATAGTSALAKLGLTGAAEALPLIAGASRFTQAGMLAKAGEGVSALTGLGGEGAGLVSKVADSAIKGAFENALWSAGSQVGDYTTGSEAFKNYKKDPNQAFETAMSDIKFSGLLGGLIGGVVGGVGSKFFPETPKIVSELDRPDMTMGEKPPVKLSPAEEAHLGGASYNAEELTNKFKNVSPEQFIEARSKSTRPQYLSPYTAEEAGKHKLYLTDEGVGFALTPENDLVGVFNNSDRKGAGKEAVLHAISQGAKTLDAFDEFLPKYYNDFGFTEVRREPFNDTYAPKDWDYAEKGRPDVVYMALPESFPRSTDEVAANYASARMERAARSAGARGPESDVAFNPTNGLFDWRSKTWTPPRPVGVDRPSIGTLESDMLSSGKLEGQDRPTFLDALREQKSNAKDIKGAASKLGVPAFEGMTSASHVIQKAEDYLINGVPSVAGINRQKAYRDAVKAVTSQVEESTAAESKYSKAELGNIFKDSITSQLEEQTAPISQLYNEIKQYHQIIPLSEKSAPAIARNIAELDELRLSPSSPEGKLANRVIDEIGNLKTVDDVKNYKSILNRSVSPTASSGEKRMVAILSDKLSDLEENSIVRFAKNEMKTPEAKQRVMNIIDQRELANTKYKGLMTDIKTLSEQLGKGRVYGPQDAMNFIRERLTPEEVVSKLFDKRNSEFMDFFSKKYPEQMQLMRDYQRDIIRSNPASPDGVKTPKAIFKEISKLEPEIRNKLFSKEELEKLGAAKTWLDALPPNFNPSGTAGKSAFGAFFEHPTGAVMANVRDFGIEKFIKLAGQDQRLVTAAKLAQATIRGETAVTNAAKKVFNPDALVLPIHHELTDSKREKIEKHIDNMTTDPNSMMTAGIQHNTIPEYAQASAKVMASGVAYLNSLKPNEAKQNPLDSKRVPTKAEYAAYHKAISLVEQPLSILNSVKDGTINSQDIKTLTAVYPNLYTKLKDKLTQAIVEHTDKDKMVPYKTRLGMSLFMGQPLDSTMTPQALQAVQMSGMNQPSQQPPAMQPGNKKGNLAKLDKLSSMYSTPLTARQQSRQK